MFVLRSVRSHSTPPLDQLSLMSVLPDFSAPSYASFGDEFESIAPAAGAPNPMADKKAAHPSRGPPTGLPPVDLAAIDPFSEAVFPVPQTPPRIKPRHGHNAQPAQSPTAKKRCAQAGCLNDRFARGYCAFHLTELTGQAAAGGGAAQPTPTTKIRAIHHLWSKHIDINKETHENVCTWSFIRGDDAHRIVLRDHTFRGERVVTINNKTVFDDVLEPGSWKLDATIGRSFKSSVNVKLLVMPHPKGYDYDCFIDELPFDEAHQMFLSKLSGTSVQQRIELSEASSGSAGVEHLRQLQLNDSLYVKQNWSESLDREKTSLAGIKSKVNWHFTIKGTKHSVILEYGSLSGKKKILLDANVIYEKKPSILSANKHKRFSFKFNVNGVECEVTAAKNVGSVPVDSSGEVRPFVFNLLIDGVPFDQCRLTESDLAGGDIALDQAERAASKTTPSRSVEGAAAAAAAVQRGRRNSVHPPLSAEEYELAMTQQNEADRQEERMRKKEARRRSNGGVEESASSDEEVEQQQVEGQEAL